MRFQCSNCMGVVVIDDSEAGHAVGCGHCGSIILVPQSRTSAGAIIDDFVIEKEIGQGGMATVYLAHQISLDRPAAIKILRDQYASNRSFIANFVKEARSAAQLNHPNIVQAYAVGEEEGLHYFAMEYVQGTSLKQVLAHSGRLVPERALDIVKVVAEALAFAWDKKQLVHLDIKPDNIIITETGETKLADLGLARIGGDIRDHSETTDVFGTPQYISPELLTGCDTDNRTDIYSLGATLYHVVTGRYPFLGQSASEIARKHITERLEPATKVAKDIPLEVSDLIDIMMAKRPGQRWQSAADVAQQIARIQAGKGLTRRSQPALQDPLNMENLDAEFAKALPPDSDSDGGGRKIHLRKSPVKLRSKSGGATLHGGGTGKARAPGGAASETGGGCAAATVGAGGGPAPAREPAVKKPVRKRKRLSIQAMLGCLGATMAMIVVAAVVAILVFNRVREERRLRQRIERMGLTFAQYEELATFRQIVESGRDDAAVLAEASERLKRHADSEAMRFHLLAEVEAARERESRELRRQLRQSELNEWRERSRELAEIARRQALDAAERRRLEEEERIKREAEERARRQREAQIRELRAQMPERRRQAIEMCRAFDFDGARLLFARFLDSPDPELAAWGRNKQASIQLAQEAFALIRHGEAELKGERFSVADVAQRVAITAIGVNGISAEYREMIYDKGRYIGDRVENVTVAFADLRPAQFARLAEIAGRKKRLDDPTINLKIGAYLLSRNEDHRAIRHFLTTTTHSERAAPMLQELEEMD